MYINVERHGGDPGCWESGRGHWMLDVTARFVYAQFMSVACYRIVGLEIMNHIEGGLSCHP